MHGPSCCDTVYRASVSRAEGVKQCEVSSYEEYTFILSDFVQAKITRFLLFTITLIKHTIKIYGFIYILLLAIGSHYIQIALTTKLHYKIIIDKAGRQVLVLTAGFVQSLEG